MREFTSIAEGAGRTTQDRHANLLRGVFPCVAGPLLVLAPSFVPFVPLATSITIVTTIAIVSAAAGLFWNDLDGSETLCPCRERVLGFDFEFEHAIAVATR